MRSELLEDELRIGAGLVRMQKVIDPKAIRKPAARFNWLFEGVPEEQLNRPILGSFDAFQKKWALDYLPSINSRL